MAAQILLSRPVSIIFTERGMKYEYLLDTKKEFLLLNVKKASALKNI